MNTITKERTPTKSLYFQVEHKLLDWKLLVWVKYNEERNVELCFTPSSQKWKYGRNKT